MLVLHDGTKCTKHISQIYSLSRIDLSRFGNDDATAYAHTFNLQAHDYCLFAHMM